MRAGATPINSLVYNNVFLDVNQLGPDNGCGKPLDCLPAGIGTYAAQLSDVESGQGWLMNGPQVSEGLFFYRNTMPDMRGSIPTLSYGSAFQNGGMMLKDNIFSLRADAYAQDYGAREGDSGRPVACAGLVNFALFSCLFPNPRVSGNVILSQTASQATLNTTGWQTNNTIPATPSNLTAVFPNYNLNPTGASPVWTGDIDPESVTTYRTVAPMPGKEPISIS
jgi:hypothetical protein